MLASQINLFTFTIWAKCVRVKVNSIRNIAFWVYDDICAIFTAYTEVHTLGMGWWYCESKLHTYVTFVVQCFVSYC